MRWTELGDLGRLVLDQPDFGLAERPRPTLGVPQLRRPFAPPLDLRPQPALVERGPMTAPSAREEPEGQQAASLPSRLSVAAPGGGFTLGLRFGYPAGPKLSPGLARSVSSSLSGTGSASGLSLEFDLVLETNFSGGGVVFTIRN